MAGTENAVGAAGAGWRAAGGEFPEAEAARAAATIFNYKKNIRNGILPI